MKDEIFLLNFWTKIIDVESYVSRVLIIDKVIMIFYEMSDSDTSGCLIRSELSKMGKKNHLPRIEIPLTLLYQHLSCQNILSDVRQAPPDLRVIKKPLIWPWPLSHIGAILNDSWAVLRGGF